MPPISPRWKAVLAVPGASSSAPYYDPVVVDQRGALIAGGPQALSVFSIGERGRLWYTIRAQSWISGFTATNGSVLVQDGPVLANWSLFEPRCVSAVNLVTSRRWTPAEVEEGADPQIDPPAWLYELPAEEARLHHAIVSARAQEAMLRTPGGGTAALVESALFAHLPGADRLIFSAPAVREMQVDGAGGRVFSLCMTGMTTSLTDDLEVIGSLTDETAPLRAELTMAELPQPGGKVLCYLYYVGRDGSIVALDVSGELKRLPARWVSKGTPTAAKVLPLRYRDGQLFGGGILGADFFVTPIDPAKPPSCAVNGPTTGWTGYEIASADKLALLSGSDGTHLIAYGGGVNLRSRWGERKPPTASQSLFWSGSGQEGSPATPKLTLETEITAATIDSVAQIRFRVLLANTVDTEVDPRFTPGYPPDASVLYNDTLLGTAGRPRSLVCKPAVFRQALYCLVRCEDPAKDVLFAYSIGSIQSDVAAQAKTILQRNTADSKPIRLQINHIVDYTGRDRSGRQPEAEFRNGRVLVIWEPPGVNYNPPAGERWVQTDGRGQIVFESTMAGYGIRVSPNFASSLSKCYRVDEIVGRRLERVGLNFIRFTQFINFDA
jgi:hypothetical protein